MTLFTRIVATTALTIVSGAALAADLPARVAPPAYVAPLPVFTWTGAYVGVNAGYVFDGDTHFSTTGVSPGNIAGIASGVRPGSAKISDDGFTAGGQIGYNYQFGVGSGIVVGIEADAAYTDLSKNSNYPGIGGENNFFKSNLDFLGTVRGRAGYAFNQFLIYGTGGFAYGDASSSGNFYNAANTSLLYSGGRSDFQTGYAYGGGIEYALPTNSFLNFFKSSAVTVKAEYLHYDLGKSTVALNPVASATGGFLTKVRTDGDLARIGLNYKF